MKNTTVKGIPVISVAEGKKLGTIDRVYLDPASRQVMRFLVHQSGGLLSLEPDRARIVDAGEVRSLGPDALMIEDETILHGEEESAAAAGLVDLDALTDLQVVTESGTEVGHVATVDFDEHTFALHSVEISPGFFQSNQAVPVDQVISVGVDVIVVDDAVCGPTAVAERAATTRTKAEHSSLVIDHVAGDKTGKTEK